MEQRGEAEILRTNEENLEDFFDFKKKSTNIAEKYLKGKQF